MRASARLTRIRARPAASVVSRQLLPRPIQQQCRTFFWPFRRSPSSSGSPAGSSTAAAGSAANPAQPLLAQNDLFHPFSQSPFPALVDKANRIKAVSLCPTSLEKHNERTRPAFDCPDCGWPTHASQSRWAEGREEHQEYCPRLREVNEDEHDIRSGRHMDEFENLPEGQEYEAAINFSSWDTFFFTRNFPSIDSDRAVRHVSKVLTYPITIASVLHQNGPYTSANSRITREGQRSMAAVHSTLHLPPGSSIEQTSVVPSKPQPPFRIFLLGARAESTLPPHIWQQITYLFPRTSFQIYFVGPEVGLPTVSSTRRRQSSTHAFSEEGFGVPSYTLPAGPRLTLISLKTPYEEIHNQLGPFDPYNDVFFAFSPGLGFPHQPGLSDAQGTAKEASDSASAGAGADTVQEQGQEQGQEQPLVQAQTTWHHPLRLILQTKCPLFFTAFSPLDLERDVSALQSTQPPTPPSVREFPEYVNLPTKPVQRIEGVSDEFELVLTPGKNAFGSQKWEIAEWDVRVGVKTNWGVWGIRGKKYEVTEGQERQE